MDAETKAKELFDLADKLRDAVAVDDMWSQPRATVREAILKVREAAHYLIDGEKYPSPSRRA